MFSHQTITTTKKEAWGDLVLPLGYKQMKLLLRIALIPCSGSLDFLGAAPMAATDRLLNNSRMTKNVRRFVTVKPKASLARAFHYRQKLVTVVSPALKLR
jgi:hypothetical protein